MPLTQGKSLAALALLSFAIACGTQQQSPGVGSQAQALSGGEFHGRQPYQWGTIKDLPHGIAGDRDLVFVGAALAGRVAIYNRATGQEVGNLPAPPGGFLLPFAMRVPRPGHLVLLDSGGFPNPAVPSIPKVYDYEYTWDASTGTFAANIVRTVSFEGLPLIFAEDVEVTSAGYYVVSESVIGAMWVIAPDGSIAPGLFPDNPLVPIPQLSPCYAPDTVVQGIKFIFAGNFGPGPGFLAERDGDLYFAGTCPGGVQKIPSASLWDATRTPQQRAADITTVSPKDPSVTFDGFDGITFNQYDPADTSLYASDTFNMRLLRIDPKTGKREVINSDPNLFNFPVNLQFLPPLHGHEPNPLMIVSDQEYRLASINGALTEDIFQLPFIITAYYPTSNN